MFNLPFYVYLLIAVVGCCLLAGAKLTARSQADGEPLGGQVGISVAVQSLMLSFGVVLVASAVVFGFPSVIGAVESALEFLL